MHAVNLLPRQLAVAPRRSLQPLALVGAGAVPVIAIAFVLIGYSSAHSSVAAEQAKFAALQAQVAAAGGTKSATTPGQTAAAAATAAQWNGLITEREARRAELDGLLSSELPWDTMLRDVARILPDDVWLTQLNTTSPITYGTSTSPSSAPAASNFTLGGYGQTEKSVALLLVRLRLLPTLTNVNLGTTTNTVIGSKPVVQFSVTATIVDAAAGVPAPVAPVTPAPTTTTPAAG